MIVTAESVLIAKQLWAAGADFVVLPHLGASEETATILEKFLNEDTVSSMCAQYRSRTMEYEGEVIE